MAHTFDTTIECFHCGGDLPVRVTAEYRFLDDSISLEEVRLLKYAVKDGQVITIPLHIIQPLPAEEKRLIELALEHIGR